MSARTLPLLILALAAAAAGGGPPRPDSDPSAPVAGDLTEYDRVNLERNLRSILQRARRSGEAAARAERVGIFADAGVWHLGAKSVVTALETEGKLCCRVLDRSQLAADGLRGLEALILPGGWAPLQWSAAGKDGLEAIRAFVDRGGRCLGILRGAYLLARTTRYEGKNYPYPLGLFDGVAEGPVAGLAPFPKSGAAGLTVTEAGRGRGLGARATFYYTGGPCFREGTRVDVLARFHDGSAAAIARPFGKGEVVLLGVHPERPAPEVGGAESPPPPGSGLLLKALWFPQRHSPRNTH